MTPTLIGLTGRAGAGKDTIAGVLCREAGFVRVAFADALKQSAYEADPLIDGAGNHAGDRGGFRTIRLAQLVDLAGWDEAKHDYPDVRRFLQRHGVAMRNAIPGCWVEIAMRHVHAWHLAGRPVVITDVRFPDEAEAIRAAGGVIARINRYQALDLGSNAGHESETNVDRLDVDLEVDNNGSALLAANALLADVVRHELTTIGRNVA